MNEALQSKLHDLTLNARALLTQETLDLLQGVYGLHPNGTFEPIAKLPAVLGIEEARETRTRLEYHVRDEIAAGRSGEEAVAHLAREVAFTHLNRLVAFKLLEARKLMSGTIDRHHDSKGFLFYVNDHPTEYALYNAGALPQDALGEGPRDKAYRHFLLWHCAELAREIQVLFDADNLPSRLFPRPRVLRNLIELLNSADVTEAWQVGNEETIGWVYQYFNEEALQAAFAAARQQKQKFQAKDIPSVTQLFTQHWIVKYLVHNTLGRLWLELHPDSRLAEQMEYLVPQPAHSSSSQITKPIVAGLRRVRDITILDPACGTMHFGLVAFDLFASMYREEMMHAGESGWPINPSVSSEDEIANSILTNNLYGIDIDLRAVQLSALTLYLKARVLNPKAKIKDNNLVCADVMLPSGDHLSAFLADTKFTRPVYERVIRQVWTRIKQVKQLGSLLPIEKDIREIIEQEYQRQRADKTPLFNQALYRDAHESDEDFWVFLDTQIVQALDLFMRDQASRGIDERYFTEEAVKGFRLLDVLMRQYDVVITNPPYMARRKMSDEIAQPLAAYYPIAKSDLYAAFIQRCLDLTEPGGRIGMLTMHSFMFISSYENLREDIRTKAAVETLIHLGGGLFATGNPGTLQTAAFVLHREINTQCRNNYIGTFFRLVKEPNAEVKRIGYERALVNLCAGNPDPALFRYRQGDFDAIPGSPWVYWIGAFIRRLFTENATLNEIAQPKHGLSTCDNYRYIRCWWEIGRGRIAFGNLTAVEASLSRRKWFPYMKGGKFRRWYGNQDIVVNWSEDGDEIKADIVRKYPYLNGNWGMVVTNPGFYFHTGLTYSYLTQGTFSARLSPGGFIFDVAGSSLFPEESKLPLVLSVLNSSFAAYALSLINPTVNFQVGDLSRLPIPNESSPLLDNLVVQAIALAKRDSAEDETTYDFAGPPAWHTGTDDNAKRHAELSSIEQAINDEVYRLYAITDEDRTSIETELAEPVLSNVEGSGEGQEGSESEPESDESTAILSSEALAQRWISYAVGIVLGRFQPGVDGALGCGDFTAEVASQLRSLADTDGIVVLDESHPDDLGRKVRHALELMAGDEDADQIIATATNGKKLDEWFAREFFKQHVQQYRKRPIYWLLQSPRKSYSLIAFYERLTADSLPLIAGNRYVRGKLNEFDSRIAELDSRAKALPSGRERRGIEKQLDELRDDRADVEEFLQRLEKVIHATNERGETVGWRPELDDGVLINLAPLRELMPSWSAESAKCWNALARGDYDWSYTAMRYWPERVLAKCKENKSYAIAHGLA